METRMSQLTKLFIVLSFLFLTSCGGGSSSTESDDGLLQPLNDTGITWAGEYSSGNKTDNDCTTATIAGDQDCHQGRDSTNNNDTDGLAGFSFIKLDETGTALTDQTASGHYCVEDTITGLTWEVKLDDGSERDKDNTYRWGGLTAIGIDHASKKGTYYDSWDVLVNYANDTSDANTTGDALCGYSDWRVPNIEELRSIAHLGKTNPAIDQNYFPNTQSPYYWSSSPYASNSTVAWALGFDSGYGEGGYRVADVYVRLVRGGQ